jgi:thiosulfate/3-mercaptopyruvate sulfurtransferase
MAACGVDASTQVVAYDNEGGIFASRLWWMLRWLGHEKVAVLEAAGRLAACQARVAPESAAPPAFAFRLGLSRSRQRCVERLTTSVLILDARARNDQREEENLDPVGGHIPGAVTRFYFDNLDDAGCYFKPADELRAEFAALLAGRDPTRIIQQCGSGVTACHNLLAMEIAGLKGSRLYPGSWSEWCADPARPVATGT